MPLSESPFFLMYRPAQGWGTVCMWESTYKDLWGYMGIVQ